MKFQKIFFTFTFFVLLVLLVPQILWAESGEFSASQAEKKIYTVIDFESTFMNRRKEEVLKALGEPNNKNQVQGKEVWKYKQMVKDKEKIWDQNIMFDFGRVNYIWSDQPKVKEKKK
jgi:hypothetical protein